MSRQGYISPIWSRDLTAEADGDCDERTLEAADSRLASNRTKFARDLNLRAHEGGWFGASSYGCEFPRIPYAAFIPTLEDESIVFEEEEPLPQGYRPGDIVL